MIPDAGETAHAARLLLRKLGRDEGVSERAIRIALREADHLAEDVFEEPAALLYALGRSPRCFPSAHVFMTVVLVLAQARALGFRLELRPRALGEIVGRVRARNASYDAVRDEIGAHLLPYGG